MLALSFFVCCYTFWPRISKRSEAQLWVDCFNVHTMCAVCVYIASLHWLHNIRAEKLYIGWDVLQKFWIISQCEINMTLKLYQFFFMFEISSNSIADTRVTLNYLLVIFETRSIPIVRIRCTNTSSCYKNNSMTLMIEVLMLTDSCGVLHWVFHIFFFHA